MSKRKLLLADDSVTIQKVVNLTFADEGIDVITVGDGGTALEKIAETSPDIVLADVHMPGLNGYQICEIIRGNEETKNLPVILLVGSFEPFDENEAERVGASAYLTKPFRSIRELVSQVSDLLAAAGRDPLADIPETGDIDSLYTESFSEADEMPVEETIKPTFDDIGIDDEMIETSYADSNSESEAAISTLPAEDEADELPLDDRAAFAAFTEQEPDDSPHDDFGVAFGTDEPDEDGSTAFRAPFDAPAYDDLPAIEEPASEQSAVDETETFVSQPEAPETTVFEEVPPENSQPRYNFEDLDLLELPNFSDGKTVEFATPEATIDAGSNKQVVSLSPELMEIIVSKVVEKLSEKY